MATDTRENLMDMEKYGRFSDLKLAFTVALHSLLTACPREEFMNHLSFLKPSQQDTLYKLYTQMVLCVQKNIEEEFYDICEETRVAEALDEEAFLLQEIDSEKVRERVTVAGRKTIINEKKNELQNLKQTLEMLKEQNCASTLRLKTLKDEVESSNSIASTNAVMVKLKDLNAKLGSTMPRHRTLN